MSAVPATFDKLGEGRTGGPEGLGMRVAISMAWYKNTIIQFHRITYERRYNYMFLTWPNLSQYHENTKLNGIIFPLYFEPRFPYGVYLLLGMPLTLSIVVSAIDSAA
jgi:hypothetical protein